jgi:DNA-binding CsgD family transcriptional regulator
MDSDPIESLTRRETEILWLFDTRLSNAEIAEVLHLPPQIVKGLANSIYRQLMAATRPRACGP